MRSGVGEYVHQVARALRRSHPDDALTLFTSSLRDVPSSSLVEEIPGATIVHHRLPVRLLNFAWHRLEWPPVEWLTGGHHDVAFSPHPLLLPARRAAQIVMVHDLDFLRHPERTHREIRRDYHQLARAHAHRADRVIVPSAHTADDVVRTFDLPDSRVAICPPGAPDWRAPVTGFDPDGYVLFMGTIEPRKNLAGLLGAYEHLLTAGQAVPRLVLAGGLGSDGPATLERLARQPLRGHVAHLGYIDETDRQSVYAGARVLVLPSFDEGFGMPALEAMSLGIPVVASARGALPSLVGDAGLLIDPSDPCDLAGALNRVIGDDALARELAARGRQRAERFSWSRTGEAVRAACAAAMEARTLSRSATS